MSDIEQRMRDLVNRMALMHSSVCVSPLSAPSYYELNDCVDRAYAIYKDMQAQDKDKKIDDIIYRLFIKDNLIFNGTNNIHVSYYRSGIKAAIKSIDEIKKELDGNG